MSTIKQYIDSALKWLVITIMAVITLNVLWQVFSRFILASPSSYTEELARYLLVWLGIMGASYVAGQKMHLAIDLLTVNLNHKGKALLDIIIQICIFTFSLFVMVIGGTRLVMITLTLNQISAALQVPLGYVYIVLPVSGLIMMFYSVYFIAEEITLLKKLNPEEAR